MSDGEIRVHVVRYPNSRNLIMRYVCPMTGKQVNRSTKTSKKSEAERIAAKWEHELRNGTYQAPSRKSWQEFRDHHEKHILSGMKATTAGAYESSLSVFERLANPQKMTDVTTARLTGFATTLREQGRTPATIARHLRHLMVVFRWGQRQGYLVKVPTVEMPKQTKGMRGRPITTEEFERMLTATTKVMGKGNAEPWKFYLRGLWASGLRLEESLALRWDDAPGAIVVDLGGRRPMLRIPAEAEKGNTHRLLPITPEFADLLATVPENQRRGFVFRLVTKQGEPMARSRHVVGPRVAEIGRKANVVTDQRERKGEIEKVFATAHDLRRAFGFRWSRRVMPTILRELMRHETVETTMKFYVGVNADATADELWRAVSGTTSGTKLAEAGLEPARELPPTGF